MREQERETTDIGAESLAKRLRELKPPLFRRYKAGGIELFGSVARREETENSDIDILVDFEDDADFFDLTGIAIFLEEHLRRNVDVVSKRGLRSEIRESVLKEAIPI